MSSPVEIFKTLREKINWGLERERRQFLQEVDVFINDWEDPAFPDLRGMFRSQEIESLCHDFITRSFFVDPLYYQGQRFMKFIILSGYKDEPEAEEKSGIMCQYRTTALHHAVRHNCYIMVEYLFHVYNRYDVSYIDQDGLTHFHAACLADCYRIVEKFLQSGQDPNVVWRDTGNTALHLALERYHPRIIKLLLNAGADPNIANSDGWTPLHVICKTLSFNELARDADLAGLFFETYEKRHRQKVEIDVADLQGNTPLHLAAGCNNQRLVELLLMRGADLNAANSEGMTPLHLICRSGNAALPLAEMLFQFCFDSGKTLQIDAQDKFGRTPLQWAVSRLGMPLVDLLLDRGADMSLFALPDASLFYDYVDQWREQDDFFKIKLAAGLVAFVDLLEQRGYQLDYNGGRTIEKLFTKYGLFPEIGVDRHWNPEAEFTIWIDGHDVLRMSPEESAQCLSYSDYFSLACSGQLQSLPESQWDACIDHLCDQLSSRFFKRWELDPCTPPWTWGTTATKST